MKIGFVERCWRGTIEGPDASRLFSYRGASWPIDDICACSDSENFDNGGEAVAYHDTDAQNNGGQYRTTEGVDIYSTGDAGGGYTIGAFNAGEWMNYTITVSKTDNYSLEARVATPRSGTTVRIEMDGNDITGDLAVPVTGDWDAPFSMVSKSEISLNAGTHVMRIISDTGGFNLNYVRWSKITDPGGSPVFSFSDDFNFLDFNKWNTMAPWKHTIIGKERLYNVDIKNCPDSAVNPFSIEDGVLTISLDKTPQGFDANGQPYTTGSLYSNGIFDQSYGYFEMRAQLPAGSWLWPAFWLLPATASLPEVDIIESSGKWSDGYVTNMHYLDNNGNVTSAEGNIHTPNANNTGTFHTYGVNLQPDMVQLYFDGRLVAQQPTPSGYGFDRPMYMIVGFGITDGGWSGNIDRTTILPAKMKIDYIRVYQGDIRIKDPPPF